MHPTRSTGLHHFGTQFEWLIQASAASLPSTSVARLEVMSKIKVEHSLTCFHDDEVFMDQFMMLLAPNTQVGDLLQPGVADPCDTHEEEQLVWLEI